MATAKKITALILCLLLALPFAAGCKQENDKPVVICTVFPLYDWARQIIGERDALDIKLLLSDGADLHSFQPTARDAIDIKEAELVIRVGGVDDSFVSELLKGSDSQDLRLIEAEGVTLLKTSTSTSHSHEGHSERDHATDEHIWLSLRNAAASADTICEALCALDPDGAEEYRKNTDEYKAELMRLDGKYAQMSADSTTYAIFADRFPFVYLAEDYGIEYEAAFEGCSADAEASFDTLLRLSERLDEWKLSRIFITESSDSQLAEAVADTVGSREISIVTLNSMQSVKAEYLSGDTSYIKIMEENLNLLFGGKES